MQRENTLKAIYQVLEEREFSDEGVQLSELAGRRRDPLPEVIRQVADLARHRLVTTTHQNSVLHLTPTGWELASSIVRNHRLWELYLTNAARFAVDHVHDDAEKIEHILGEDVVRALERRLDYATVDPHGRTIPQRLAVPPRERTVTPGFEKP